MVNKVTMQGSYIVSLEDMEALVLRPYGNGNQSNYCFVLDIDDSDEPNGKMRVWVSDELNPKVVERIRENSRIFFSAERDDDGDMVMTKLKVIR